MTLKQMRKRAKWLRPLSGWMIRHLEQTAPGENGFPTLRAFKANMEAHRAGVTSCRDCEIIARKLGI